MMDGRAQCGSERFERLAQALGADQPSLHVAAVDAPITLGMNLWIGLCISRWMTTE